MFPLSSIFVYFYCFLYFFIFIIFFSSCFGFHMTDCLEYLFKNIGCYLTLHPTYLNDIWFSFFNWNWRIISSHFNDVFEILNIPFIKFVYFCSIAKLRRYVFYLLVPYLFYLCIFCVLNKCFFESSVFIWVFNKRGEGVQRDLIPNIFLGFFSEFLKLHLKSWKKGFHSPNFFWFGKIEGLKWFRY